MNIRYDLLKQIDPLIADSHNTISPEEYYRLLCTFREKYPEIDGMLPIPLTFSLDQRFYDESLGVIGIMKAAYGIKEFYEDDDHNLKLDIKSEKYLEMLKFMARLNKEELIDPEWPIQKYTVYMEKLSKKVIFSTTGAWFEMLMGPNPELEKKDPSGESQYRAYVLADETVENPPLYRNSDTGDAAITITRNCKNPVKAIEFLDFMASPDGNFLNLWGPEGMLWEVADGKRVVKEEYIEEYQADTNGFWNKYKVRLWNIANTHDNNVEKMIFSDGTTFKAIPIVDNPTQRFMSWQRDALINVINTSYDGYIFYDGVYPPAGTEEAAAIQKFSSIKEKELIRIILESKDDAAVEAGLNALVEIADSMGIEKYEEYITMKYKDKLEMLKK
jgi:putative aldouronate transport system substrate-binding protein